MMHPLEGSRRAGARQGRALCVLFLLTILGLYVAFSPVASARVIPVEVGKYYVVQPSYQGQPEFVYEIAQRFLGDGARYPEIVKLNINRGEPGGAVFRDPTKIRSGWVLRLPNDAQGRGLSSGVVPKFGAQPLASATATAPKPTTSPSSRRTSIPTTAPKVTASQKTQRLPPAAARPTAHPTRPSARIASSPLVVSTLVSPASEAAQPNSPASVSEAADLRAPTSDVLRASASGVSDTSVSRWFVPVGWAVLAISLILFGLYLLHKARKAHRWWPVKEGARSTHKQPYVTSDSWTIDRSLRVLAMRCSAEGVSLPGVYALTVGNGALVLRLSTPRLDVVTPWVARDGGRIWAASLRDLQILPIGDGVEDPYPLLATLGLSSEGWFLIDLAKANGVICIDGDRINRDVLAARLLQELGTSPWSRRIAVLAVGFDVIEGVAAYQRDELTLALDSLDHHKQSIVFLSRPPTGYEAERLRVLVATPGTLVSVVVVGLAPDAKWRFVVSEDGLLETGFTADVIEMNSGLVRRR